MALAAAAGLPPILLAAYLVYGFGKAGYDNTTRELVQRTESTAHAVSQQLDVVHASLTVLSHSDAALGNDLPKLYEASQRLVKSTPAVSAVSLIGADRKMVFLTLRPYVHPDARPQGTQDIPVSDLAAVQQVFQTGRPAVSAPFPSPVSERTVTSLAVPIVQDGKVVYCLRAIIRTDTLNQLLARQDLPQDWTVAIVDKGGLLLARSRSPERYVGKPGSDSLLAALKARQHGVFDGKNKEGVLIKTTIVQVPGWDWSVAIGVPIAALEAPMRHALMLLATTTLAVGAVGFVLSLWLARFITGHVKRLTRVAAGIHRGDKVDLSTLSIKELVEVAERLGEVSRRERRTHIALQDVTARSERTLAQLDSARHDALTHLPGRALFFELVDKRRRAVRRPDQGQLALLFIDLDGFKAVNDQQGHQQGDRVLVEAAGVLTSLVRDTDVAGRLGGDEFVICLVSDHGHIDSTATEVAERVLAKVRKIGFDISCSIGIAVVSGPDADVPAALSNADEAMYEAKRRGKNRAVVFGREPKLDGTPWGASPQKNA